MTQIDNTDKLILSKLQNNSKISHKELATQLHLSRTPVFERIRKLERRGIIKKYIALLNPKTINKGLTAFCFITLTRHGKEQVDEFANKINTFNQVMECYHMAGNFDFFMKIVVKDMEEYQKFVLKKLSEVKNISNIRSTFVLGELKYKLSYDLDSI